MIKTFKNTNRLGLVIALAGLLVTTNSCNSPTTGQNGWTLQGVNGPNITYGTNTVTVSAVLANVQMTGGLTFPLSHMPNSFVEIAPDVTGGLLLQLSLNTADVLAMSNATFLPPNQLPGGRPLPGIAGGVLPSIAVQIPQLDNTTFYIGPQVVGIFVPVQLGLSQVMGTFSYYDSANKLVGDISVIGEDVNNKNSGFLLLLNINNIGMSMLQQNMLQL